MYKLKIHLAPKYPLMDDFGSGLDFGNLYNEYENEALL